MKNPDDDKAKLLISYRRSDSQHLSERVAECLSVAFGADSVFLDTADIPFGREFDKHIQESLKGCRVLLAMIGQDWLNASHEDGQKRLFDENDTVRRELEWARESGVDVVPVLLDEARMPKKLELPQNLQFISDINALPVRSGQDFQFCTRRLILFLQENYGFPSKETATNILSWINGLGIAGIIISSLCSISFLLQSILGLDIPLQDLSDFVPTYIAFQLMGPILLGGSILATAYGCHKSCVLRALERGPEYMGLGNARKIKHPAARNSIALGLATFGWNLFAFVPCVYQYIKGVRAINAAPERYEGLRCSTFALLFGLIGLALSSWAQKVQLDEYCCHRHLDRAWKALENDNLELAISEAKAATDASPFWPKPWYILGKAEMKRGNFSEALEYLDQSVKAFGVIYKRDSNLTFEPLYLSDVTNFLLESYELRARCYEELGNGEEARKNRDRAVELSEELSESSEK